MKRILIVGNTLSTCIVAAELASSLHQTAEIQVIESLPPKTPRYSAACETLNPLFHQFHQSLNLAETELLTSCLGTFNLATRFINLGEKKHDFTLGFSPTGIDFNHVGFQHYFIKQSEALNTSFDQFSLAAQMARNNQFVHPVGNNQSVLSTLTYGLNVDCELYANRLKNIAISKGVNWHQCETLDVHTDTSQILGVNTQSNTYEADIYIDCTHNGALINTFENSSWQDWRGSLPFDRVFACTTQRFKSLSALNSIQANPLGILKSMDLQNRTEHQLWYNSTKLDALSPDLLVQSLLSQDTLHDVQQTQLAMGCMQQSWINNCIAMGQIACNITPMILGEAHVTHGSVMRLVSLLPSSQNTEFCSQEYNRLCEQEWTIIRDFHAMYFQLTQNTNSAFWRNANKSKLSDDALHRLRLFEQSGNISKCDLDPFSESMWSGWLLGLGVKPEDYAPNLDIMGDPQHMTKMKKMLSIFQQTLTKLPSHDDYLSHYLATKNEQEKAPDASSSRVYL